MSATATDEKPKLPALQAGGVIRAIVPTDFDQAWRIASAVHKAGMAPKGLDTPEMCTIAIMQGLECGMAPMMALQSIAIINKRPTIFGDGALGLCQGSGKMEWIKEWYEGDEGKDGYTAYCDVKRLGDPEIKHGKFSIADAKLANLWAKAGPWTQYWRRMLQMRARAFALRDGFSDVLKGLGIAEEVRDTPMRDVTPPDIDMPHQAIPNVAGQKPHPGATAEPAKAEPAAAAEPIAGAQQQAATEAPDLDFDDKPAVAETKPLDGEVLPPDNKKHPDDVFLEYADHVMGKVTKAEDLETTWNDHIAARLDELSKGRHDDAYALLRKHEIRLGG